MTIFNSYVSLPEGNLNQHRSGRPASAQLRAAFRASRPKPMASVELSAHSAELHFLRNGTRGS
jgi:hypothetical protein